MRKVTRTFEVYQFNELGDEEQTRVLNEVIEMLSETPCEFQSLNVRKAWEKAESMYTPWFVGSYIMEYAKNEIFNIAQHNEYLKNGKVFIDND